MFAAVGTVSHELGHLILAKSLGYETALHYGSVEYENFSLSEKLSEIYRENKAAIENETFFDQRGEYEKCLSKSRSSELLIAIGGPLQTLLTGTIGLSILFYRRKRIEKNGMNLTDWLSVFLALFWLRQVFNVIMTISGEVISPDGSYFGGDEEYISKSLNLWPGTVSIVLGILGSILAVLVVFKVVPRQLILTFVLSGLIGGVIGFVLWMNILGPRILP